MPDPARTAAARTPDTRPDSPDVAETRVFAGAFDPDPARVVHAGAGVHRLVFAPGLTTAAELADALADVPAGAVLMGGAAGLDEGELEFVVFPDPAPDVPELLDLAAGR